MGSPRGLAHAALIRALTAHDVELLNAAVEQASRTPGCITEEGLAAAERALQALAGSGRVPSDAAARRRYAAQRLQAAVERGSEDELQRGIMEAVEAGVEEGLGDAGRALAAARVDRTHTLDALVVAMEVCVESVEKLAVARSPPGVQRDVLERYRQLLHEARRVAGPQDDLVVLAGKFLDFEDRRAAELQQLDGRLQGHLAKMEGIADDIERRFPPLDGTGAGASSSGAAHVRATAAFTTKVLAVQQPPSETHWRQTDLTSQRGRVVADSRPSFHAHLPGVLQSVSPHDLAGIGRTRGGPDEDLAFNSGARGSLAALASKRPVGLPGQALPAGRAGKGGAPF